jgi:hypothetical protein
MTTQSRNIRTDALDFDTIKENIKEFLRGQSEFTDYDFDGSALSIFLDVLAYNTHYNSLYTNLAVNEMFLDSATKYSSVVSLAKTLGYTAKSVTSARAKVNITINSSFFQENLIIPAGTVFRGQTGGNDFTFIAATDYAAQGLTTDGLSGIYRFFDVELIEGTIFEKRYTNRVEGSEFVIPNRDADISTLRVKVQDNASSGNYQGFGPAENFLTVGRDSRVFFVKQREDLYYEIYFGNNVIGKAISPGNIIHLNYVISSGEAANGSRNFAYSSGLDFSFDSIIIDTISPAFGGANEEDIESIRFNAPRAFSAQGRAVTAEDYKNVLYNQYPIIETITTWGGQESDPPVYGKVFISAKPTGADFFTDDQKQEMANFLKNSKGVVSVTPEMIDPKFIRVELNSQVYYNRNTTRRTVGEIQSLVKSAVEAYGNSLGKFGSIFRHSRVVSLINLADESITSNITTLRLRVSVEPLYNKNIKYEVKIANPIFQNLAGGSFTSTRFFINSTTITDRCFMRDNGRGVVQLLAENERGQSRFIRNIGRVDYRRGTIIIPELSIRGLRDDLFEFVVAPLSNDVIPAREYILELPPELININMVIDSVESTGSTNTSYRFSPSR